MQFIQLYILNSELKVLQLISHLSREE